MSEGEMEQEVELWRLLLNFTLLALGVVVLEKCLHLVEHRLERYPKYHQMISKAYRELMILGFIGLGVKFFVEVKFVSETSTELEAFESADLTIFILAVALIVQAIIIFLQLRRKNKRLDKLELLSCEDLHALAIAHQRRCELTNIFHRWWYADKYDEVVMMRILRHLFLGKHSLPELFPFATYLRQAQDNQISYMIDIELSMWLIVFFITWAWYASVAAVSHSNIWTTSVFSDEDPDSEDVDEDPELKEANMHFAIAAVFIVFAWLLTICNTLIYHRLTMCLQYLLKQAGVKSKAQMLVRLQDIGVEETMNLVNERTVDAIKRMEDVQEQQQLKHYKKHDGLTDRDTGFQLLATYCCKRKTHRESLAKLESTSFDESSSSISSGSSSSTLDFQVPWISRKLWHFAIKFCLILNGVYTALFIQTILYRLSMFFEHFGVISTLLIPVPLAINMMIQTRTLRLFVLVCSLARVDVKTLSDVIAEFIETVHLQNSFIGTVRACLREKNINAHEFEGFFHLQDPLKTGWVDLEEMRQILSSLGFQISFYRFNSVMRLLFHVRHLKVDYRKVTTLLIMSEDHDSYADENTDDIIADKEHSFHRTMRLDLLSLSTLAQPVIERDSLHQSSKIARQIMDTFRSTSPMHHAHRPAANDRSGQNQQHQGQQERSSHALPLVDTASTISIRTDATTDDSLTHSPGESGSGQYVRL